MQDKIVQRPYLPKGGLSCKGMLCRWKIRFHNDETLASEASVVFDEDCVVFLAYGRQEHFTAFRSGRKAILSLYLLASHIYRKGLEPDAKRYQ